MKFIRSLLLEVSTSTHLMTIRDEMYQLKPVLDDIISTALQSANDNTPWKEINMRMGSRMSRWFGEHYLKYVEPAIRGLEIPGTQAALKNILMIADRELRAELEAYGSRNFLSMMQILPELLRKLHTPQAIEIATQIASYYDQLCAGMRKVRAATEHAKVQYAEPKQKKSPNIVGSQNAQAEAIINSVLSTLPKSVAGDIRNAISKSPNKLQALQAEMTKRGLS